MASRRQPYVGLLRGINVGGRHKVPMATLREVCARIGLGDVETYIQSGNLVFSSDVHATTLESRLEEAIEARFRFPVPVIVRPAARWRRYVTGNPFADESNEDAKLVHLALSRRPPAARAEAELRSRAVGGETVIRKGDALWIHFASGVGRSKLTPAVLDRIVGSPVTARNWRTVCKLGEMVRRIAAR